MKAKTKLTKLWSFLLSLVMLLSLLPTTALAATYYDRVKVNDILLENGHYLASNSSTSAETGANTEPTTYVAWYKDGVLTLKGYNGKGIETQGVDAGELTVKLIGTNSINNGSLVSDNGGNIIVTSDSSGTLSITQTMTSSGNAAIGIETGLSSSYTTGSVKIKGDAEVTIDMTHTGTSTYEKAYGIYAKENITISESASVGITCATPNNTTGGSNCNGMFAKGNVSIDTTGKIKIDVTKAGRDKDNGYSYGVCHMGTATLTKVGNMEVQWKKEGNNTRYSGGAFTRGATFSDTDHAINVDTTNCYASYRYGEPRTVTVENGAVTGTGVPNAKDSGKFLAGDKVNITPAIKKSWDDQEIPFKEWTSSDVTLDKSATTASNFFTVPGKDVTVTAKHSPFVGTPTFTPTGTTGNEGTLTFKTVVKADEAYEGFRLVKEAEVDDTTKYKSINPSTTSPSSPYEYSYETNRVSGVNQVDEGNYYVVAYLNNDYYLSEKFTVDYTAAPTVTYPDHVRVFNASGDTTSLSDKQYLAANDAASASDGYDGTQTYVARYDKSSGTLYLKDYHGIATHDMIFANGDLNIEVESNSSFTTSTTATGNLYGIRADSGKLNISGSGKLTVTAKGRGNVYGISAKEGVTISAPLDVRVGKNNVAENGPVYGIYAQSGAISLDGNDMIVTATGGTEKVYGVYNAADTSTTITDNGNIGISGTLTVNLSNGSYNRGISSQGGVITLDGATVNIPGSYYCGIFNLNGNVVIENNSNVELTSTISNGEGICAYDGGNLTIENSTVKVSAKGYAAEIKGNVSIKDSMVELTRTSNYYEVIRTGNSSAANTIDLSGTGTVTLTASGEQTNYAMITGKVTLGPNTKCEMGTPDGNSYDGVYDATSDKTVLKFVHETTTPAASVNDVTIDGTTGTAIANKDVVITLTNDKFNAITAATDVKGWFTNLPTNLDAKIKTAVNDNDTTATIEISGTPSVASSEVLAITIPAANLVSNADLTVTSNANAKYNITAPATPIAVPAANTGLVYDGTEKIGVSGGTGYTLGGTYKATNVGTTNYAATATLETGYKWNDGSTDVKTINWNIGKRTPTATDFTFAAPTDLTYDGTDKTASVTLKSPFTKSGAITVKYEKDGASVTETKDVGTYTVKIDVAGGDNFDAGSNLNDPTWTFSITPAEWGTPTETLTPVNPTTAGGSDGQITGTTSTMQYKKSTDSSWKDCTGNVTGLTAGTYYVRYKADGNHTASDTNYKTVTLTDPGATLYGVTVTDGTATPTGNQAAGTEVTITANTKTGFNFKEWTGLADSDYKTGSTKTSNPATFVMPASAVNVTATYDPAALTGTASITGTEKFGQTLTANTTGITNNTGTFSYQWKRDGADITSATNSTYTLVEDDIGKTITVAITSNVQTGEITGSTTGTIEKADGPVAPSVTPVACTNSSNNDGKITGVNTTMEYSAVSDFATKTACTGPEITGLANGTYYVRVAETTTHKEGAAATVSVPAYTVGTLGGSASISGTAKYGEVLTAETASITGNTGTLTYKWYRGSDEISGATGSTYTLVEEDIGKTITVKITSSVESGTIVSSPTAAVEKADGPAAPAAFTLTFTPNADGTTYTATIPTVAGGEYSFDGTNYSATNSKADCAANTGYTGYVRIAETSTHKASTATSSMQTSPKLTVATPTFTPNGASGFTGTQSVTISCTTAGAKIYYTTDGTTPTTASTLYTTALSLTSTTTVKAIAVNTGMNDSAIATATFTKYSGGGGGGGGSYTPSYTVSVNKTENGTITVSPKSASKGDTVTITVKPDKGYELEMLKALDKDGDALKLTEKNGKYTFTMPASKVTVKGKFVEEAPEQIFADVPVDAYYYEAVKWAAEKGITGGVGNGLFAPNQPCTRAQIVTFLWRAAGSPAPKNMSSFADVPADAFYAKAVAWAVENGITGGTGDGKFSPDATCTRAQSVTFLYRAAGSPKVSGSAEFGDVATNAYYADAVAWAAKNGITGGIGGGLFGSGNDCTRAQIVTFLYRSVK